MTFEEADSVEHPVETQWHYSILTKHGFVPITKTGKGFVRSYEYKHLDGRSIKMTTGVTADYWNSSSGRFGYWSGLEKEISVDQT